MFFLVSQTTQHNASHLTPDVCFFLTYYSGSILQWTRVGCYKILLISDTISNLTLNESYWLITVLGSDLAITWGLVNPLLVFDSYARTHRTQENSLTIFSNFL
jgi:hypothetical protein